MAFLQSKNSEKRQNSFSSLQETRNELIFGILPFFNARNPKMQEFLRFEIFLTIIQCDFQVEKTHHDNTRGIFLCKNSTGFGFLVSENGGIQKFSSFGVVEWIVSSLQNVMFIEF